MSAATIRHGGARAFYQPGTDEIHLPPGQYFPRADRYYATALHELTHWTSHARRCNRQLGQRFGDDAYAAEELIAEMGAAFLCAHCHIDGRHAPAATWLAVESRYLADGVGFEPTRDLRPCRFSRPVH